MTTEKQATINRAMYNANLISIAQYDRSINWRLEQNPDYNVEQDNPSSFAKNAERLSTNADIVQWFEDNNLVLIEPDPVEELIVEEQTEEQVVEETTESSMTS